MCGIAGVIAKPGAKADEAFVLAMIERLSHRGPDGIRVERLGGSVVAHARLSIIDLEGGWQPLHGAGSTVIGNGEIYNYLELMSEFGLKEKMATVADFEPLLHLYRDEGPSALRRLRGMYALCLMGVDGRVFLARDPFGIKPLYLKDLPEGLAFASEPRAFGDPEPTKGADELLALHYRLDGVRQLAPGEVVEVVDGRARRFDTLPRLVRPPVRSRDSEAMLLKRLDKVLENAVMVHQRSDVPYGLFLSGGIDSTAIAALMARLSDKPVTAFTCGFTAPDAADERAKAEKVARALDLDWRETTFTEEDFWRIAPEVAWALDDPTTDFACLPTYKLAEAAKDTLTVVLSGEGGDELFAGYGRYRRALRSRWLGGRPAEPQLDAPYLADGGEGALRFWRARGKAPGGLTPLQQAQWADMATWLPNDLLLKLDRCLMAHGLEGRTPFLDREVAAFAFSLPDHLKVRGRMGKWLLRQWLSEQCPAAEPFARKQGFTVPVAHFIAPWASEISHRVAACPGVAALAAPEAVTRIFNDEDEAERRWPLLFYALWWTIHVAGATPAEALTALGGPTGVVKTPPRPRPVASVIV